MDTKWHAMPCQGMQKHAKACQGMPWHAMAYGMPCHSMRTCGRAGGRKQSPKISKLC